MRHGGCVRAGERAGERPEYLWPLLSSFVSRKETTWVYIPDAKATLGALGFFDRLDDGRIELSGRDWKTDRGAGKSGEDKTDGLCVLEDPPTLVLCRPRGAAGKWLILDTRNYGVTNVGREVACGDRAAYYLGGILSIVRALRTNRPVSLRGTAASQAMQILRTRYDCVSLHCHTNTDALKLERAAYFGGRCEAYRTGPIEGPVYHLDVRSMYPSICLALPVPVSIRRYTDDPTRSRDIGERAPHHCCAHVEIQSSMHAFPVRGPAGIVYPGGHARTFLCGQELRAAVERGCVTRWLACAEYTCAPALGEFYRDGLRSLDAARREGSALLVEFWKRVLNSLVGKFGEPGRRWVGVPPHEQKAERGPTTSYWRGSDGLLYRNIGWYTQRLEEYGESYHSIPAIAAFVCAAGRVFLWQILQAAGRENVWYCDTDSVLTNATGRNRLVSVGFVREGQVGYLRTLGVHNQCHIFGVRHYSLDGNIRCAGVENGAIREGETREHYWDRKRAER